jgi:hypothetical protein
LSAAEYRVDLLDRCVAVRVLPGVPRVPKEDIMKKIVRGVFDNGDLRFAEPVNRRGCWAIEITFLQELDEKGMPLEANPHRPELGPTSDRLEEFHRQVTEKVPHVGPY